MNPISTLLKPQLLSSLHSPNYLLFIPQITFYWQPKLFPISTPLSTPQIISYLYSSLHSPDYLLSLHPLHSSLHSPNYLLSLLLSPLPKLFPISTPPSAPQIISYLHSSLHLPNYLLSLLLSPLPKLSPISTPPSTPQIFSYHPSLHGNPQIIFYLYFSLCFPYFLLSPFPLRNHQIISYLYSSPYSHDKIST